MSSGATMCYCWRMTNIKRMLMALAAACGLLVAAPIVTPAPIVSAVDVEIGPAPMHVTTCYSWISAINQGRAKCDHIDAGYYVRVVLDCGEPGGNGNSRTYGPRVYSSGTHSIVNCYPSSWIAIRTYKAVYDPSGNLIRLS